jgi:hypothetical protein
MNYEVRTPIELIFFIIWKTTDLLIFLGHLLTGNDD